MLGATIHQAATEGRAERAAIVERVVADLRADGRRPHVIPVGGTGIVGALGQVLAGMELIADTERVGHSPDDLIVPSATGGTQAGLLVGLRSSGATTVVHGFAVTPPDELRPAIAALVRGLGELPGLTAVDATEIVLDGTQLGEGYGRRTQAADEAANLLAQTEGILVDPIYTAKALAGLVAMAREGRLDGRRVVFWHAGGTPGLFEPLDA